MNQVHQMAMACASALTILFSFSSCSLPAPQQADTRAKSGSMATPPVSHIAQIDHGPSAHFAQCIEPACPVKTLKTLAVVASDDMPVLHSSPRPVAPSAPPQAAQRASVEAPRKPQVIVLQFATDSAVLTPAHKALLSSHAHALGRAERIVILGRTDDVGAANPNQAIALARAAAVRDHLRRLVPALPTDTRIDARGLCCYAASNDTEEGRAQNRRVELVFTMPAELKP
jgi:outer membrane protein OmpA-like peptidoglycan-associated protein